MAHATSTAEITPDRVRNTINAFLKPLKLHKFPNAKVAGGAALAYLTGKFLPGDIDVFVCGPKATETAVQLVEEVVAASPFGTCVVAGRGGVVTVYRAPLPTTDDTVMPVSIPVQIIATDKADVKGVLDGFDLNIVRVAGTVSVPDGPLEVVDFSDGGAAPGSTIKTSPEHNSASTHMRQVKYAARGYTPSFPLTAEDVQAAKNASAKTPCWYYGMTGEQMTMAAIYMGGYLENLVWHNGQPIDTLRAKILAPLRTTVFSSTGGTASPAYYGISSKDIEPPAVYKAKLKILKQQLRQVTTTLNRYEADRAARRETRDAAEVAARAAARGAVLSTRVCTGAATSAAGAGTAAAPVTVAAAKAAAVPKALPLPPTPKPAQPQPPSTQQQQFTVGPAKKRARTGAETDDFAASDAESATCPPYGTVLLTFNFGCQGGAMNTMFHHTMQ